MMLGRSSLSHSRLGRYVEVLGDHVPTYGHHLVFVGLEGVQRHLPGLLPSVHIPVQGPKRNMRTVQMNEGYKRLFYLLCTNDKQRETCLRCVKSKASIY